MMRTIKRSLIVSSLFVVLPLSSSLVFAQTAPAAAPPPVAAPPAVAPPIAEPPPPAAEPTPPPPAPEKKRGGAGPGLSLSPDTPQAGGRVTSPAEPPPVVAAEPSAEWKFDVTGYFRAPMRLSWGPATTQDMNAMRPGIDPGRSSARRRWCPTPTTSTGATPIAWSRPWTELNFHYGNDRVKAHGPDRVVQPDRPRLPAARVEPGHQPGVPHAAVARARRQRELAPDRSSSAASPTATARPGRYDAGKYETYLFGRTHVAGVTRQRRVRRQRRLDVARSRSAVGGSWSRSRIYGAPRARRRRARARNCRRGSRTPARGRMESTFVAHVPPGRGVQEAADPRRRTSSTCSPTTTSARLRTTQRAFNTVCTGRRWCAAAPADIRWQAAHHDLWRRRQAAGRRARRRLPRLRAPRRAERDLPARRDRGAALVRRLAAARQLLRRAGLDRSGDRARSTPCCSSTSSASAQLFYHPPAFWGRGPTSSRRCSGCTTRSTAPFEHASRSSTS